MVCCPQIHEVLQFPTASFTPQLSVFLAQHKKLLDSRLHMLLWQPFPQALRSGATRWWWNKTLILNRCSLGVLRSQAHLRAQALCGAIVKRTFSKQGCLTLWPVPHKWTWRRARFICGADMKDNVTSERGETKEAPFSSALTCLTMSLARLASLFARYSRLKIKRARVSPHSSRCECLWQESARPNFHSQWHWGALWPAAKLKIVLRGLARHTHKNNRLYSNKLINSEHTQ